LQLRLCFRMATRIVSGRICAQSLDHPEGGWGNVFTRGVGLALTLIRCRVNRTAMSPQLSDAPSLPRSVGRVLASRRSRASGRPKPGLAIATWKSPGIPRLTVTRIEAVYVASRETTVWPLPNPRIAAGYPLPGAGRRLARLIGPSPTS